MNLSRFDDFFFTIVKETGGIEGLLHSIFNFLLRRTDFFYEMDPGDKMGFPPGVAAKMVMNVFNQYQQEYYKKIPKKTPLQYEEKLKKFKETQNIQKAPQKPIEKTIIKSLDEPIHEKNIAEAEEKIPFVVQSEKVESIKKNIADEVVQEMVPEKKLENQENIKNASIDISTYNGGITDKYIWSQSVNDVTVQVKIPKGTKSKQLAVKLEQEKISIKLKNNAESFLEGELYDKIKVEDSIWSIEDEEKLIITLEKGCENIWKTVIKGDTEIDATKVDNSKKLEEFDFETQGALRKIMYEQQRKNMGLPTTEEEKQQEMLQKAWNAEGSPFKGTPFDPSKFNLSSGGMQL